MATFRIFFGKIPVVEEETATSAGSYNMYQLPLDEPRPKRRKIKYIGPAGKQLLFYVEDTRKNNWIPDTIRKPSVLAKIEKDGLVLRQQKSANLRRIIMADDEWFMLN